MLDLSLTGFDPKPKSDLGPVRMVVRMRLRGHFIYLSIEVDGLGATSRLQLRMKPSHSPSAHARVFSIASPRE